MIIFTREFIFLHKYGTYLYVFIFMFYHYSYYDYHYFGGADWHNGYPKEK